MSHGGSYHPDEECSPEKCNERQADVSSLGADCVRNQEVKPAIVSALFDSRVDVSTKNTEAGSDSAELFVEKFDVRSFDNLHARAKYKLDALATLVGDFDDLLLLSVGHQPGAPKVDAIPRGENH